jgi:outer membrane protein assembly factor BamB
VRTARLCCLPAAAALIALWFAAADWPRFRGPAAEGVSDDKAVPDRWSATENVAWKTALPGPGASSPIVAGEKVFVTCYSGYGLDKDAPGREEDLRHHLVCVGLADGKIIWDKSTKADLPEKDYMAGFIYRHGYASGTPVTDGKAVYAFFGRSGVYAYDLEGKPLWHAKVGDGTHSWGSGTSPIVCGDLVIVNASVESESIVALRKSDGGQAWRLGGIVESWSTPLVVDLPGGKQELVVSLRNKVLGIDPAKGEQLWECSAVKDYVCPAVVAHRGIVYVSGGRSPCTVAIRAGGRGDVTRTHVLWEARKSTKVPTPLYYGGHLYWIDEKGFATCLKADDGQLVYQERLKLRGTGDKVYASLVVAGGKLFCVTREDGTVVFSPGPKFEELARNRLNDSSIFNGTPAIAGSRLLVRSDRHLYCLGK